MYFRKKISVEKIFEEQLVGKLIISWYAGIIVAFFFSARLGLQMRRQGLRHCIVQFVAMILHILIA